MTNKQLALLIAIPVAVIAALGTVGVFTQSAFSSADTGGVISSGPLAQNDAATPMPTMETPACNYDEWVGMRRAQVEPLVNATGRPARILPPGSVMTMDYRAERINVELDDADIVVRVFCG